MSIVTATQRFEDWLRTQCAVVDKDLDAKHERMAKEPFKFLRATFYRWAAKIEEWCPELAAAPQVLAVGDTHTENFGTWRDAESRLVWGTNDFDEAAVTPYPFDLVRLAASAALAMGGVLTAHEVSAAILSGYRNGLSQHRPTLLDEQEMWMRPYAAVSDKQRQNFWSEIATLEPADPPSEVCTGLAASLPNEAYNVRFRRRVAGGGSLGRPRFVAVADWRGGQICREAKAQVASAWSWTHRQPLDRATFMRLALGPYRSPDPLLQTTGTFIYRRLAADSRKVELGDDAGAKLNGRLLEAMGFDLGSIHAAHDGDAASILVDLSRREDTWLANASQVAAAAVKKDFDAWQAYWAQQKPPA